MEYQKELEFAKQLALDAGKIMQRYFRADDIGTITKKDDTPLTVADTQINQLVINRVREQFPDHGVIGEEASADTDKPFVWVVDPIDGTVPFSLGMPISMFSLALVDRGDGQAIVAVTYDPQLDQLYSAVQNQGARLNNTPIATTSVASLQNQVLPVHGGKVGEKYLLDAIKCLVPLRERGAKHFSFYSHIYPSVRIASGEIVGSILGYGSPWDSAAVSLIVMEAGGIATDIDGNVRRYDEFGKGSILAANKEIHQQLVAVAREACA